MSMMDYTKFVKPKIQEAVKPVEIQNGVEHDPEPAIEQTSMVGVVVDCTKLNVRQEPRKDAAVVCEIPANSELTIYEDESTEDFYKVCTAAGAEGFCMRKFIRTK